MKSKEKYTTIILAILFVALSGSLSRADNGDPLDVTARVDKEKIAIGDRIKLDILVEKSKGEELLFPGPPEKLGEFVVVDSHPIRSKWPRVEATGQAYVLSIYTTGTHVIPPVQVKYRAPGEADWQAKESPQVPIEVQSLLTGNDTDIRDLKGLAYLGGNIFLVISILAIVLAVVVLFWMRRRKKAAQVFTEEKAKQAHEIAYEQLNELKAMDLPGKGRVKEYYIRLSDIVRHYLEDRFSYRAPEMTTEEFLSAVKDSNELETEHKRLLKDFLSHCDMVKFAKYGPTPLEILDSFKRAERLVDQTRIVEEEEAAG